MVTTVTYPSAPTTTPPLGTLLDTATVSEGMTWIPAEGLFDSYNCMQFGSEAVYCGTNNKTFDQSAGWQDGAKFAIYGGAKCKAIGLDMDRQKSEVGRVFAAGESEAVERGLMQYRFKANAAGGATPGEWVAPVDITPAGGAVKPAVGLALLEGHAAANYVGMPTLHIPRVIASLILGVDGATLDGKVLRSKLGSKIAAGAGYDYPNLSPTGTAAPAGEKWLYATGEVVILRSAMILHQEMDRSTNEVVVLAEREYIVAVDCYTSAIRVQVTA